MADKICTRFIDNNGLDIGCNLVTKEYMLEAYPDLVPWIKAPALWSWGKNAYGELGNSSATTIDRSSPVQTISNGTNWMSVAASSGVFPGASNSGAIKTDGTLWIWGEGANGRLGNNFVTDQSSPIQTVSNVTTWRRVSTGAGPSGGIKTDGTLWMWGCGVLGSLGTNDSISRSSPVQTFSAGTNWKSIKVAAVGASAIKADGTLWLWGANGQGRLGINCVLDQSSPVQTLSAGTNWKSSTRPGSHTAAVKTDGSLWIWGYNSNGQLGTCNIISRSSPVQTISAGTDWRSVSTGTSSSVAIKNNGTLWTWGSNTFGQLGNNATINHSSPVQTVSGGTNWFKIDAGTRNVAGIKTDGTLWVWGVNAFGALGNHSTANVSSPVQTVSGGTGWRDVVTSGDHMLAIRDEGEF